MSDKRQELVDRLLTAETELERRQINDRLAAHAAASK